MKFIFIVFSTLSVHTSQHLVVHESEALKSDDIHFELLRYLFLRMLLFISMVPGIVNGAACEMWGSLRAVNFSENS